MFDYFKNRDCNSGGDDAIGGGYDDNGGGGDDDDDDENGEEAQNSSARHLVYSLVLDHAKRRITVVFRGSVTPSDWAANRDAFFVTVGNPLYTGKKKDGDSEGGGNDDTNDEVDGNGQPRQLILHRGFYEYVYKSIGDKEYNDDDTKNESRDQQQTIDENAQKSAKAASYPTNDAMAGQHQPARTKMEEIVAKTKAVLDDHPDYEVFTTGVSLSGALTTVFAFFAAACYPELGPITYYSSASPSGNTILSNGSLKARSSWEAQDCEDMQLCRSDDPPTQGAAFNNSL